LALRLSEGLGRSARWRARIVPMKLVLELWQKMGCGADQGRTDTGAQCPRVRLVLGDVIDIGERQALVFLQGAPRPGASRLRE
jgi:hypothetical protein